MSQSVFDLMLPPKPAHFLPANSNSFRYVEKTNPSSSHLQFLTYGVYELAGQARSGVLAHPGEEALLFCWQGNVTVRVAGGPDYSLEHYDVLYIPSGARYDFSHGIG